MNELGPIIEQTYSAAIDPAAWPDLVGSLQKHFACTSAGLYNTDPRRREISIVNLRNIDPTYVQLYIDQYLYDNPWQRVPELQALGVIRTDASLDEHYNEPGYYRRTAYFNEFMKPQDFVHTLGVNLSAGAGVLSKLYLYRSSRCRPFSETDVERLRRLTPHLMKAVDVARRLADAQLETCGTLRVLDTLDLGVIFLDEQARVIEANDVALSLLRRRDGVTIQDAELSVSCRDDAAPLARAVDAALNLRRGQALDAPSTVRVRRASSRSPLRITAVPLPARVENPFCSRTAALAVVVVDPERDPSVDPEDLRRRHGLTRAEARLAQVLARGVSLREAADQVGVRYETARSYLKSIFQKTGASRQSELVRIMLQQAPGQLV